jgi:excisionase family DNA binding protein
MPTVEVERTLLTDRDVAARLNVSRSFVHKLNASGRLPQPVKLGRARRWRLEDLKLWEALGCPSRDSDTWQSAMKGGSHA